MQRIGMNQLAGLILSTAFAVSAAPAADDSAEVHYFYTTMILTAPFPLADRKQWGSPAWSNQDIMDPISYYRCDNVAISDLQMRGDLLPNNVPASSIMAEPLARMRITVSTKLD